MCAYKTKGKIEMGNIEGKPFTDVLGELENGDVLHELTAALYRVVRAVQDTRKPGTIKIAVKVTPTGRGSVELDTKFDAVEPEHDRPTTTFFVANDGSLLRNDPNQPRLPLREVVDENTGELRTVGR